jgi:hypothetical protein
MEAPRFAAITLSIDTAAMAAKSPQDWEELLFLIQGILIGQQVERERFRDHKVGIMVREAVSGEIVE